MELSSRLLGAIFALALGVALVQAIVDMVRPWLPLIAIGFVAIGLGRWWWQRRLYW